VAAPSAVLTSLARAHGIQPCYRDVGGRLVTATPEVLLDMLRIIGAPLERLADAGDALRQVRLTRWQALVEPVSVIWDSAPPHVAVRIAADVEGQSLDCVLQTEAGETHAWRAAAADLRSVGQRTLDGRRFLRKDLSLPIELPWGYHRLQVEMGRSGGEMLIIRAPRRAYEGQSPADRYWGGFLPLYSLWKRGDRAIGNLSDLGALMDWLGRQGGRVVATLPLLAGNQWQADNPSPYSPTSRLFWNEVYLDARQVAEYAGCAEARHLNQQRGGGALDVSTELPRDYVDFRGEIALNAAIVQHLATAFFADRPADRQDPFAEFLRQRPDVQRFAQFRATERAQGKCWLFWPDRLRAGQLQPGDFDPSDVERHLFAQWQMERQMTELARRAQAADTVLYLDLPLGVDHGSFDVWQHRDLFVPGATGGAPPDAFQPAGQDWGFAPLHPQRLRQRGYDYQRAVLRHHLRHGRLLRLDHVMSLERLYWVPQGAGAQYGAYVRYPREELLAILALESQRHQAFIVGENLGTVPQGFNAAIARHGIGELYVLQYELESIAQHPPRTAAPGSAAGLNTHDMPPFAAFWSNADIDDRLRRGMLDAARAEAERELRRTMHAALLAFLRQQGVMDGATLATAQSVFEACLVALASSAARFVLVNLEDLWQEARPQNRPGHLDEENWRRLTRWSFDEFSGHAEVLRLLRLVDQHRRLGAALSDSP